MLKLLPLVALCISAVTALDYGIVSLDSGSFPLVVGGKYPVFVRFERVLPYGDEHEAFLELARVVAKRQPKIIIAQIAVDVHLDGQHNMDMAKKFGFIQEGKEHFQDVFEALPKFMYFKPGDIEGSQYTGPLTKAAMLEFLGVEDYQFEQPMRPPPQPPKGSELYNMVTLDESTLPLLTGHKLPAFVRFVSQEQPIMDQEHPQGQRNLAFKKLAFKMAGKQVLIGHANYRLAQKYWTGMKAYEGDNFPRFRYYPSDGGKDYEYKGTNDDYKAMRDFLKRKKGSFIFGKKGALPQFDKLVKEFMKSADKGDVLQRAKKAADLISGDDKDAASYYVTAMEKTHETADWFQTEYDRLEEIVSGLSDEDVGANEKNQMQLKMNRLSAFGLTRKLTREEEL
mmetsp:Transcript_143292/g.267071  ORF Transcript_143292/g.267071 Transcript_143292/m.267071 type:complete len:396 (-) Transcript_143292:125-1312(-)